MTATLPTSRRGADHLALGCFIFYLIVAYFLLLFHFGKDEWFIRDDWQLLVESILPSVFTPMEEHWITLPILVYRAYFRLFGANYTPFLATVIAFHLGIASLLRVIMRRAGVNPWVATLCAAPLALFGPGYVAIIFSIGLTQDSSMFLGLTQLILADHDGPIRRNDWLGLLAGALAIMCSGVAPIVAMGIGLATLLRRGVWVSGFHTAPLAALYGAWFVIERPLKFEKPDPFSLPFSTPRELGFIWQGLVETFAALGHFPVVAVAMVGLLAYGVWARFRLGSRDSNVTPFPMSAPLALLACAPLYFGVLGLQRSKAGIEYAGYSHHLYTGVCFCLPALAYGVDAIIRRWQVVAPAVFGIFLVPIPFHCREFDTKRTPFTSRAFTTANKRQLLAIAHSPYPAQALHLDRSRFAIHPWYDLRLGWVLDQAAKGRFGKAGAADPTLDDQLQLFFGLDDLGAPPFASQCPERAGRLELSPRPGEEITTTGPVAVVNIRHSGPDLARVSYRWDYTSLGHIIRAELPDLHIRLEPIGGSDSFAYCSPEQPIGQDPRLVEAIRRSIMQNPDALNALRNTIAHDPNAMEAIRRALQAAQKQ